MEALCIRIEELKVQPRGLTGLVFAVALGDLGSRRRPKYPLPELFDRDPRKL